MNWFCLLWLAVGGVAAVLAYQRGHQLGIDRVWREIETGHYGIPMQECSTGTEGQGNNRVSERVRGAGNPSRKLYRKAMEHKYGRDWKERVAKCGHNKVLENVCQDCGKRL